MFENLQNPAKLQKGDTVSIVAPSSGLAGLFPHRLEKGIGMLEEMGFRVLVSKHAREQHGWVSDSPQNRAQDLHKAFSNSKVKAVICSIGGNHANQILKYLDYNLIKENPKIFLGYSDITVLHYAIAAQAKLRTFYGPCVISEFGDHPEILPYTREYFDKALLSDRPVGDIVASKEWTDEFLDWFEKKDLERPRVMHASNGHEWWRKGVVEAPIWGGAVPSINHMAGTDYWVDPMGTIFFIDIPEGDPGKPHSQSWLDSFFADLDNLGVFSSIKGLIIGRPYGYGESEHSVLKDIIQRYTEGYDYPILYNANIGHTAPIITVPLGSKAILDSSQDTFSIQESGVK